MNYKKILEGVVDIINTAEKSDIGFANICTYIGENCPELAESEDEKIKRELIDYINRLTASPNNIEKYNTWIAWLERQGSEPKWCHHKVDLSGCSEEYRKAYYDGWNNCNHQHSQCKSERNYVVKCLINGMKFYYEDNEEATWGTEKFSMKVKDILSWLEKQGEQKHFNYENANIQQKDFAPQKDIPRYSIGDVLCDKSCTTLNKESQSNFEITDIRNGMFMKQKQSEHIIKWNNIPKDKDGFFDEGSDLYDRLPIIVAEVTDEDVCLHYIDVENWHDTLADLSRSRFKYYIQVEPLTTEK